MNGNSKEKKVLGRFYVGTAGIPHSTSPEKDEDSTSAGIRRVSELGLSAMELEFVKGVYIKSEKLAYQVRDSARKYGVVLTTHAPYYINLANPEKVEKSKQRILFTMKMAHLSGVKSVVFHPAYYGKEDPEVIFVRVRKAVEHIMHVARVRKYKVELRPETAGKVFQFGSLDEIIRLCKEIRGIYPCVDFAHIYARSKGEINGYDGFMRVLEKIWKELGDTAIKNMHCHIEGIEYNGSGEVRHLNFKESGFDMKGLAKALKESEAEGILICESPSLEYDALEMRKALEEVM